MLFLFVTGLLKRTAAERIILQHGNYFSLMARRGQNVWLQEIVVVLLYYKKVPGGATSSHDILSRRKQKTGTFSVKYISSFFVIFLSS